MESAQEKSAKRMGRHPSAKRRRKIPAKKIPDLSGPAVQDIAESSALLGLDKGHAELIEDASIEAAPPDTPEDAGVDIEPLDNEAVDE